MRFKEWLLTEAGFDDSGSDWFYGSSLYPSDAFDWQYAQPYPSDFLFLQSRWQKERDEWGRKFHNMNLDGVLDTKYIGVYSNTMPGVGRGFWKHKPDKRPNLQVDNNAKLYLTGHRRRANVSNVLYKSNDLIDKEQELNQIFGKFEPKYYELPKDFDKPWVHNKSKGRSG